MAEIKPGRQILEIGPGLGILTGALLEAGASVTAVEVDPRLGRPSARYGSARWGRRAFDSSRRTCWTCPLPTLSSAPFDVVANLPYHITSPVMHQILGGDLRPKRFVLMVQREVAERIAAPPGGMSYLSVFVQYHAAVRVALIVPPHAFEPAPSVESAVLVGEVRPRQLSEDDEERLWRVAQAGFRERRKMLHNVLPRQLPQVGRERFEKAHGRGRDRPDRRPQTLSVDEWMALADAVGTLD